MMPDSSRLSECQGNWIRVSSPNLLALRSSVGVRLRVHHFSSRSFFAHFVRTGHERALIRTLGLLTNY